MIDNRRFRRAGGGEWTTTIVVARGHICATHGRICNDVGKIDVPRRAALRRARRVIPSIAAAARVSR
jgi:hypothetical protein